METKTEYKVATLDYLKLQARGREIAREVEKQKAEAARRERNESKARMLLDMLTRTAPYSEFFERGVVSLGDPERDSYNYDSQIIARFVLPEHAELQARCVWKEPRDDTPEHWEHRGFLTNKGYDYPNWIDDPEKMWRVSEWTGTKYEPETETYYAAYRAVDFKDLGDALLHAEREYRDPADIQREVDDCNTMAARNSPVAEPKVPEPTTAEILADALKNFVQEQILSAREFSN